MTEDEFRHAVEARGVIETVRQFDTLASAERWRFTMANRRQIDIQVARSSLRATYADLGELLLAELDVQLGTAAPPTPSDDPEAIIEGELIGFRQWSIDLDWKLAGLGVGVSEAWYPA